MRLVIICEGHTEEAVLKDFLKPYCSKFSKVTVINARGSGNIAGKGTGKLKSEFKTLTELELDDDEAVVFCLIDLYQAPFNFPKSVTDDPDPLKASVLHIQKDMKDQIDKSVRDRFYPIVVVQEIETWILADEEALKNYFSKSVKSPYAPESIEPPSDKLKQLSKQHRKGNRSYSKTLDGLALFRVMDAKRVYADNCPHFKAFIDQLIAV